MDQVKFVEDSLWSILEYFVAYAVLIYNLKL